MAMERVILFTFSHHASYSLWVISMPLYSVDPFEHSENRVILLAQNTIVRMNQ